jgi:hypothetical protein
VQKIPKILRTQAKDEEPVRGLPTAEDEDLIRSNSACDDWISRDGALDRSFNETSLRERTAVPRLSRTGGVRYSRDAGHHKQVPKPIE